MLESDSVAQLLGEDPWLRFDMWSARSWEMAERAVRSATESGPMPSSDDGMDARIVSLFHAAQVAKEFAEMVNPLSIIPGAEFGRDDYAGNMTIRAMGMITDTDDLG